MNPLFILLLIILVILLSCLIGLYSSPLIIKCNKFGGAIPNPNKSEFLRIYEETDLHGVDIGIDNFDDMLAIIDNFSKEKYDFSMEHADLKTLEKMIEYSEANTSSKLNPAELDEFKSKLNTLLLYNFKNSWLDILYTKLCNIDIQSINDNTFILMCLIVYDLIRLSITLNINNDLSYLFNLLTSVENVDYKNILILLNYIDINDLLSPEMKAFIHLDQIKKFIREKKIAKIQPILNIDQYIIAMAEYKPKLIAAQIAQEEELRTILSKESTKTLLMPYENAIQECNSDTILYIQSLDITQIALLLLFIHEYFESSYIDSNVSNLVMNSDTNIFMHEIIDAIDKLIKNNNEEDMIFHANVNISIIYLYLIFHNISNTYDDIIELKSKRLINNLAYIWHEKYDFLYNLMFIFAIDTNDLINHFNSIFRDIIMNLIDETYSKIPNEIQFMYIYIMLLYRPRIYSEGTQVFTKYSIIELQGDSEQYMYIILQNIKEILLWSRKSTKRAIVDVIFDGENDTNRDKFLNNLGLLIVGYDNINREYICILLYPFLFKAYKAYQMTIDAQSDDENIFAEGDPNYTKKGGGEHCIVCPCTDFIPKEDDAELCTACGHTILQHNKTERLKSTFKKMTSSIISQKNIKEKIRQKNKLEFLILLYIKKFEELGDLDAFKFFKIPFDIAKKWRPMLIKSFSQYKEYYSTINPANSMRYKDMKKFYIDTHGSINDEHLTIELLSNEIVIMSCHILETVNSLRINSLINAFISPSNNDLIHIDNIEYIMNIKESSHRTNSPQSIFHDETFYGNRNNYCIYTKKCPNLNLSFYDYDSEFRDNLPFFTYETPMRYTSPTIRDFLTNLELTDRLSSTSPEILDLPLNVDTNLHSPNMLKYLFNDMSYLGNSNPTESQVSEYKPRIRELVDKLSTQKNITREVQTYYDHIDFRIQEKGDLFTEINNMRRYWQSLPEEKWENNPNKYVIYFVGACRS